MQKIIRDNLPDYVNEPIQMAREDLLAEMNKLLESRITELKETITADLTQQLNNPAGQEQPEGENNGD
jgi:hypothetical protein